MDLSDAEFEQLLALRTGLRRFLRGSEERARAADITPAQHQLLLAVRGSLAANGPTVGEVVSGPDAIFATCLASITLSGRDLADARARAAQVLRQPPVVEPVGAHPVAP